MPNASSPGSLSPKQIKQIERALQSVGEFGEVRLVLAKGRLRFIQKVISEEAVLPDPVKIELRVDQHGSALR
jgi:hypothetical protein